MSAPQAAAAAPAPAEPVVPWPTSARSHSSSLPAVLGSVLAVAGLLTLLFVRNHRFFFIDDRISEAIPKLLTIGRALRAGEWPWLTTDFVNGGGHAVEYQHAVFNPVNLLMSMLLVEFDDAALGAFVYVLAHALLLTAAAAWLARLLGLNTAWSIAFAVSVGFGPYTVFWGAAAWFQGVNSFAWFVLAVAASVAFHQRPARRYGWVILLATYGCFTSGWPLAIPVLGLFAGALVVNRLLARQPVRETAWLAAWFGGGAVCSLPALYPLLVSFQFASRNSSVSNASNFNVVSLDGLVQFANPAYYGFFTNFDGYTLQPLPHFYAAWFILPVLVFWRPRALPPGVSVLVRSAVCMVVVSAVLARGPERLLVFRFPTRFLQYFGFFLLVLTALLVAHGAFTFSRKRVYVLGAITTFLLLNTLQADPLGIERVLVFGAVVGALFALLCRYGGAANRRGLADATVLGGTVAVMLGVALLHPSGRGVDWGFPHDLSSLEALSTEDYTLYYGNHLPTDIEDAGGHAEYRPSTMGLMVGDRQVNGYSPLGNRFFREHFPIDDQGNFEPGAAQSFTRTDSATGLSMLELLRVDQIIARLGPWADELDTTLDDGWERVETKEYTAVYRHDGYREPGLVSFASAGVVLDEVPEQVCERTSVRECVAVEAAPERPGSVVFARLWFPGYRISLDGSPLEVERHAGMLLSADIPPGETGLLEVSYRPPGLYEFGALALLALIGLAVASVRWGRVRA